MSVIDSCPRSVLFVRRWPACRRSGTPPGQPQRSWTWLCGADERERERGREHPAPCNARGNSSWIEIEIQIVSTSCALLLCLFLSFLRICFRAPACASSLAVYFSLRFVVLFITKVQMRKPNTSLLTLSTQKFRCNFLKNIPNPISCYNSCTCLPVSYSRQKFTHTRSPSQILLIFFCVHIYLSRCNLLPCNAMQYCYFSQFSVYVCSVRKTELCLSCSEFPLFLEFCFTVHCNFNCISAAVVDHLSSLFLY